MSDTSRSDLTGAERAVSKTLDEVNFRMHGLMSSGSYHQQFIDWLAERGYTVVPAASPIDWPARFRAAAKVAHRRGRIVLGEELHYAAQGDPAVVEAIGRALLGETSSG